MTQEKNQEVYMQVEIKITGQVQGVFFRQETKNIAESLGLSGFVQNEPNASVLIVAEGKEANLQKLIEWAKVGTKSSSVESVSVEWGGNTGEFLQFEIR